ncbi:hypothetical protein [Tychonema sp. LEGE 07203]|uniref:hypothetical protein n=1 Tax=Tychonema sp. LEGE 07203 TaxID=1828671 RepID=UPI0018820AB6|nr:hypothetical protein [Tychonema sp. LEGE 07203]MBE9095752.1 hypothetical protein [Tychonema sp. LEGE 07203]
MYYKSSKSGSSGSIVQVTLNPGKKTDLSYLFRLHRNHKIESTVNTQPFSFSTRPSTVNSQQSTVNSQQSTVNSQQSTIT